MDLLQSLIDAASAAIDPAAYDPHGDNAERVTALRAALATACDNGDVSLAELERAAIGRFESLRGGSAHSPAALAQLGAVVDVVDAVRAEGGARADADAAVAAFADRLSGVTLADPQPAEGEQPEPPQQQPPQPEQPQQPAPQQPEQPAQQPPQPQQQPAEQQPAQQPAPGGEAVVTAAGRAPATTRPRVPMAALPSDRLPDNRVALNNYVLTASADIPGVPMGTGLDGMAGLTQATSARMQALNRAGKNTSAGIAVLERQQPDERLVCTGVDGAEAIAYACDESRLPGGSLTAAAGWCAPCQVMYDFCPTAVVDGILNLPTVTATRGCLQWPQSPDFSAIYTQTGFYMSHTEMEKPETGAGSRADKPCYLIPCPGVANLTLDVAGLCIQAPILTERAYPELITYTMAQAMAGHAHKMNAITLAQMEAMTTQVTLPGTNTPGVGPGATAAALALIELQVYYLRYRHRLGMTATIEMVAPAFMRGILRSDLSKRTGVDMLDISDAQLDTYLRNRGVNPQWVLDWQDAFAGAATPVPAGNGLPVYDGTGFGGDTAPLSWPETVRVMLYPAGTFFKATNDLISLDGLYDSTLLARNLHLALFTEEGIKVGSRNCYRSLTLNIPLCPDGQTGALQAISCTNGAA